MEEGPAVTPPSPRPKSHPPALGTTRAPHLGVPLGTSGTYSNTKLTALFHLPQTHTKK